MRAFAHCCKKTSQGVQLWAPQPPDVLHCRLICTWYHPSCYSCRCRFAGSLGAFINLESTGPLGPDVLFQNTGDWPLEAYARSGVPSVVAWAGLKLAFLALLHSCCWPRCSRRCHLSLTGRPSRSGTEPD